jgi:hypothetical protein
LVNQFSQLAFSLVEASRLKLLLSTLMFQRRRFGLALVNTARLK